MAVSRTSKRPLVRATQALAAIVVLSAALRPAAGGTPDSQPAPESAPATQPADQKPPAPGPRFFNLRYDEDYRYLDQYPEARGDDPRMKLKNLHLDEHWRLDVGGEFRLRAESRTNQAFGRDLRTQNAVQNYRWMLHANLRYDDVFRLFVQGVLNHVEDQDLPFQPLQENHGDVQQLFADVRFLGPKSPLTLRVGRQEFDYGIHRLVGPFEWVSNRRRFDAVKIFYTSEKWNVDAFYAKPVVVRRGGWDRWNEQYDFYGLYATYKFIPQHGIDFYFFGQDRTEDTTNPNGRTGDKSVYTLGSRFFGKAGGWDYDTELTGQWGRWAGDSVGAWSWAIDGGYTFGKLPLTPRLSTGFDLTTGDSNPRDRRVGTFDQLFAFDHVCVGILDLIGRQNMNRAYVALDTWPIRDRLKASVIYNAYWLYAEEDSLYDAGGFPGLRDPTGGSGKEVGSELDLWFEFTLTAHSSLVFAYAHFFDDRFEHRIVQGDDDPDLFILQYRYRF